MIKNDIAWELDRSLLTSLRFFRGDSEENERSERLRFSKAVLLNLPQSNEDEQFDECETATAE